MLFYRRLIIGGYSTEAALAGGGKAGVIRLVGFSMSEWAGLTGCGCTTKRYVPCPGKSS